MNKLLFSFCILITLSSCWNKTEDEYNDVHIRLENHTGKDLTNITLGKRIYKPGGLRFVEYKLSIDELKNNAFTDYFDTQGKFKGYESFRAHINGKPLTWYDEDKDEVFLAAGAYQDSWQNPFTGNEWEGYSLEKGNYTYKITLREDERSFLVEIVEE